MARVTIGEIKGSNVFLRVIAVRCVFVKFKVRIFHRIDLLAELAPSSCGKFLRLICCGQKRFLSFHRELENRQKLEVEKRQQQTENKSLRNSLQQLESDVRDLKRALAEEQDARAAQSELLEEERRKNDALVEESRHHSLQKTEALYQLEAVDKTRKSYEQSSGSLREELKAAQVRTEIET